MRYTPKNRNNWRNWLQKNHANETEVWLVFLKKHTARPNLSYNDAVEEALCFGWIDGIKRSIDKDRYMHRFTPRKPNSSWSESNKKRARCMIDAGQMAPAGKRSIELAKKNGKWTTPVGRHNVFKMPPELKAKLESSDKAASFFASLPPSYQRQYIAWIATAKRPKTKQGRLDEAIQLLERGKKLGMR
ncbi:MAG: YdeI/OmpD-associated family protein [Gammaproteobacteria bacterium]|nr:YdeI/OmpD-associated family protein [Gammaproteobacteria bacterium]